MKDIQEAVKGGADRVELVTALREGGYTPSIQLTEEAIKISPVPVHVMLRLPKQSFQYSTEEKKRLRKEAHLLQAIGVKYVVLGLLDGEGLADVEGLEYILEGTDLTATFHRAFDESSSLLRSLERINNCQKITHLLTSGGPGKVTDNLIQLKQVLTLSRQRVILGSGVNTETLDELMDSLGSFSFDLHVGTGVRSGDVDGDVEAEQVAEFTKKVQRYRKSQ